MASQEDHARLGTASAGGTGGSSRGPEEADTAAYQRLHGYQKGALQALGFLGAGSLPAAAGRKPTGVLIQNSFGMDIASAFVASIGTVLLSIHLALNSLSLRICPSSPSPDLCVFMGSSSDGPVSLMPILTLLELGINISVIAMWYKAKSREAVPSPPDSVEAGAPPEEA